MIRSLTMLLASGVELKQTTEVVPILLDPDLSNGDLVRTSDLLVKYQKVRNSTKPKSGFFKSKIKTLSSLSSQAEVLLSTSDHFKFDLSEVSGVQFGESIGYNGMAMLGEGDAKNFVDLFYSESELESDMSIGFRGRPNIGSVVLDSFFQGSDYREFCQTFQPGDRIVIVSSIFGGTGAAGFPLLLRNLRANDPNIPNSNLVAKAPIASVNLQPYFKLEDSEGSDKIDSSTFLGKTKAALGYYQNTIFRANTLNYFYYAGFQSSNQYANNPGSTSQLNNAHIVELIAALAVVDFTEQRNENDGLLKFKEFGLEKPIAESERHPFYSLDGRTNALIRSELVSMWVAHQFMKNYQENSGSNETWRVVVGESVLASEEVTNGLSIFLSAFQEWLEELADNSPGFEPFSSRPNWDSLFNHVNGLTVKKGIFGSATINGKTVIKEMNKQAKNYRGGEEGAPVLLSILNSGASEVVNSIKW